MELIVTSPLTRTLETTLGVFDGKPAAPVAVNPLLRERLGDSCDIGRPSSVLGKEFPLLDFSHLPERWWHEGPEDTRGVPVEPREQLSGRVTMFKEWLVPRDENVILVVSHSEFLERLCGVRLPNSELYEWTDTAAPQP